MRSVIVRVLARTASILCRGMGTVFRFQFDGVYWLFVHCFWLQAQWSVSAFGGRANGVKRQRLGVKQLAATAHSAQRAGRQRHGRNARHGSAPKEAHSWINTKALFQRIRTTRKRRFQFFTKTASTDFQTDECSKCKAEDGEKFLNKQSFAPLFQKRTLKNKWLVVGL